MSSEKFESSSFEEPAQVFDDTDFAVASSKADMTRAQYFCSKVKDFTAFLNTEMRGLDRVPEEEQTDSSLWSAASMWFAANMVIATFSLGTLGISIFGLAFWDSVICIILFSFIGVTPVAFYSCFGPEFGLRQMALSRYWWGYQGVRLCALLNCIACVGWSAVNTIASAQLLNTVNNGGLPPWGGIIVITFGTIIVSFLGYKFVHLYEKWSWIPNLAVFFVIIAQLSRSNSWETLTMKSGPVEAGNFLSFGGAVFGFATGWSSYAADYTVYMPKKTNKIKIFGFVLLGVVSPLLFILILGAAAMACCQNNPIYAAHYAANNVGGLVFAILVPESLHGFGQFCVVILSLSTIANNVPNMYSIALSAQAVWSKFRLIPRVVWTIFGNCVAIAIAIPAYFKFEQFMNNFMNLIGYWLAIYQGISLSEHFIYRKGKFENYDVESWEDPDALPISISALFAFACGCAGACVGMSQVWWVGPIARLIGNGGDIGFELSFGFAVVGYNLLRFWELKFIGR